MHFIDFTDYTVILFIFLIALNRFGVFIIKPIVITMIGYIVHATVFIMYVIIYAYLRRERAALDFRKSEDNNDLNPLTQWFVIAISLVNPANYVIT
uniref:Amino acid transporter n=1 Tax=Heterorhabditis bacteriophora TaxID=37862 RepID=A0A1I7XUY0_HETBA